ncbi:Peptide methionine sulfoxide reductase MsrB [Planctomycetes bacterium Pla163]|uniref:peptide-methionine (R)-S-oxide reductase n=1 Tax=Rohdeia mirabilis TaxID=2528008 RepID=A0A518D1K6_9BACT|nr:Peptide methionine sulfoxide reductase MsrB [Planctomycetes bacterium Pla163]
MKKIDHRSAARSRFLLPVVALGLVLGCSTGGDKPSAADVSAADPTTTMTKDSNARTDSSGTQPTGTGSSDATADGPRVSVRVFDRSGQLVGPVSSPKVEKTREEWIAQLGLERFKILRAEGTERPFCGTLLDNKLEGVYTCAGCDLPLFTSASKFDSGTGWPSFFQPIAPENITEHTDTKLFVPRTEIECTRCGGHLGHVFTDGPKPTGLRYCLNSEALFFTELADTAELADPAADA